MSSALDDEIVSINSIYSSDTLTRTISDANICILRLPSLSGVGIRLYFPPNYPEAPPDILGTETVGDEGARKGKGKIIISLLRDTLARLARLHSGDPCVFDLIQEAGLNLEEPANLVEDDAPNCTDTDEDTAHASKVSDPQRISGETATAVHTYEAPEWISSEAVTEKKSVFRAHVAEVHSASQAKFFVSHLKSSDRKIAKATHNITAWRINAADGVSIQDCDDDGETAAGGRVLHLLQIMDVWNVIVIVSRWYGGIQLGPDRFRIINNVTRNAILKGGFDKALAELKHGKAKGKG